MILKQNVLASESVSKRQLIHRNRTSGMICWVLAAGNVVPLAWLGGFVDPVDTIADVDIESTCFVKNVT